LNLADEDSSTISYTHTLLLLRRTFCSVHFLEWRFFWIRIRCVGDKTIDVLGEKGRRIQLRASRTDEGSPESVSRNQQTVQDCFPASLWKLLSSSAPSTRVGATLTENSKKLK